MPRGHNLRVLLGFATIYLVWGSTYLAIRLGVETIPAFLMASVRFVIGGAPFYAWARFRGAANPRLSHLWPMTAVGLLLVVGGNGLVTLAEETVPSGIAALLVAMVPFWIVMADWLSPGGKRPVRNVLIGLVIGFLGVGLLINPTEIGGLAEINILGALTIALATILWASGSIYSRHARAPESQIMAVSIQMFTGGIALLLLSLLRGETDSFSLSEVTTLSALSLVYLATIGSFAFGVYMWLLKASTPSKVATYAYVNPVIALFLGSMIADEAISPWTIGCSIIVLLGVFMIVRARSRSGDAPARDTIQRLTLKEQAPMRGLQMAACGEEPCACSQEEKAL
ncbi:MAG: EamA family transporter [Candidatus Zixiibacteriota bacterium]